MALTIPPSKPRWWWWARESADGIEVRRIGVCMYVDWSHALPRLSHRHTGSCILSNLFATYYYASRSLITRSFSSFLSFVFGTVWCLCLRLCFPFSFSCHAVYSRARLVVHTRVSYIDVVLRYYSVSLRRVEGVRLKRSTTGASMLRMKNCRVCTVVMAVLVWTGSIWTHDVVCRTKMR